MKNPGMGAGLRAFGSLMPAVGPWVAANPCMDATRNTRKARPIRSSARTRQRSSRHNNVPLPPPFWKWRPLPSAPDGKHPCARR